MQLISERQAAGLLAEVGLSRRHARRVLASGLAGSPLITSAATLFDRALVEELVSRPLCRVDHVDTVCPRGLFIARRDVDVRETREEQCRTLESGWGLSWLTAAVLGMRVERDGPFPFVATVAGFVAFGGSIEALSSDGAGGVRLHLGPPGQWFSGMARAALVTGPGRDWIIRGWSSSRLKTDSFPHGLSTFPSSTLVAGH